MGLATNHPQKVLGAATSPHFGAYCRIVVGLGVIGLGLGVLARDVPRWNAIWYVPAWYGYLLVLDGLITRLGRPSFLTHRRRELASMLFWSVPFWFVFEAYNLVLENWYYVFVLRSDLAQGVITWLAFATVLPACFLHADLMAGLGLGDKTQWRSLTVDRWVRGFVAGFGSLCIVLPFLWPRYTFWMIWGAALGVPEVINYRSGAASLLRDLEAGRPARLLRLLVGGMIAGLVWEGFNYFSRCKWIYTVPGLEHWKLFEMPLPGFVGFPFLALEAFALYSLLCHHLRGGRRWEVPDDQPSCIILWGKYTATAVAAMIFSVVTLLAVLEKTAHTRRPILNELRGLDADGIARLREIGVRTPEQLARAIQDVGIERLARKTNLDAARLDRAGRHAALALHKAMGAHTAGLLLQAGIVDSADFLGQDPTLLWEGLRQQAADTGMTAPTLAEVKVWIRAARHDGKPRR